MRTSAKRRPAAKTKRLNFRASAAQERLIRLGAKKQGEQVTRFMIQSACAAAEIALADQTRFELSAARFAGFAQALDRPARVIPALRHLFATPSLLEGN